MLFNKLYFWKIKPRLQIPLKQSDPHAFQHHGTQLCFNMLCLSKHPLGTQKGPRFKSSIMEVFRNHTKPPKRQWISIFLLRPKKKKERKKVSTHWQMGKWCKSYGYRKWFCKSLLPRLCSKVFKTKRGSQKLLIQIIPLPEKSPAWKSTENLVKEGRSVIRSFLLFLSSIYLMAMGLVGVNNPSLSLKTD